MRRRQGHMLVSRANKRANFARIPTPTADASCCIDSPSTPERRERCGFIMLAL
jgi:hypothetical protein